jgi:hypothetical protein
MAIPAPRKIRHGFSAGRKTVPFTLQN